MSGGKAYKKRSESSLLTACLDYLILLENLGEITHVDRLNSGTIFNGRRKVRLCRSGTPDAFFILNNGLVVWVETKSAKGKQTDAQAAFMVKVKDVGHLYWVIRSVGELIKNIDDVSRIDPQRTGAPLNETQTLKKIKPGGIDKQ